MKMPKKMCPVKSIRKLVTLSHDTAQRVEEIRTAEGIPTYSGAMLRLIIAGLSMWESKNVAPWFAITEVLTHPTKAKS